MPSLKTQEWNKVKRIAVTTLIFFFEPVCQEINLRKTQYKLCLEL